MFRQMTGDLLYYLSAKRGEAFKEGMDYLIDNYILGRNDVWKSQDDSLKVTGMAMVMDDLLSKWIWKQAVLWLHWVLKLHPQPLGS